MMTVCRADDALEALLEGAESLGNAESEAGIVAALAGTSGDWGLLSSPALARRIRKAVRGIAPAADLVRGSRH